MHDLFECLQSISGLDYPKDHIEIIIEDNGSTDPTSEMVKKFFKELDSKHWLNLRLFTNNQNLGASSGRNKALQDIDKRSDFVLFLDDDIVFKCDLVEKLVAVFENSENAGIVGARIMHHSRPDKTANGAGYVNWWFGTFKDVDSKKLIVCDYVITCCCMIKRDLLEKIGGFDPDYFTYHEDVDICVKAKRAGFKVIYEPDAVVLHKAPLEGKRTLDRLYYLYRNEILFIRKNAYFIQKAFSLSLYALFFIPRSILNSVFYNKRIVPEEIKVIILAGMHGFMNRKGQGFVSD